MAYHKNREVKEVESNSGWRQSALEVLDGEYHIVHNGILNRADYSLLFEGGDGKKYLPVEATTQLNVYSDVEISPAALRLISAHNIRVAYFDGVGRLQGYFVPAECATAGKCLLEQCRMYDHPLARLSVAKEFEKAGFRNMLANLRYYAKIGHETLRDTVRDLAVISAEIDQCQSVDQLMLKEARGRMLYYSAFDEIMSGSGFEFGSRSKRPPKNEINAMLSFGNAMLYNKFLQLIWRTQLDARIGVVHATNQRPASLHLDFADVFKPLVVDRVVFSLVNRHEIRLDQHFRRENGAVLLNDEGRRVFVEKMERKFAAQITVDEQRTTYEWLMASEVARFQEALLAGELYTPFKYR